MPAGAVATDAYAMTIMLPAADADDHNAADDDSHDVCRCQHLMSMTVVTQEANSRGEAKKECVIECMIA